MMTMKKMMTLSMCKDHKVRKLIQGLKDRRDPLGQPDHKNLCGHRVPTVSDPIDSVPPQADLFE